MRKMRRFGWLLGMVFGVLLLGQAEAADPKARPSSGGGASAKPAEMNAKSAKKPKAKAAAIPVPLFTIIQG